MRIGDRGLFTATIFVGSFLLFLVQPMIARMALPRLGGAPAVWNTAMLFYQVVLLGGYLYAHAVTRLPVRGQVGVHLALLVASASTLPIGLADLVPPANANPAPWLLFLLGLSIGPLFFAVSAQAPLMQAWFARCASGAAAPDPYFLYAASNAGSLLALLSYPLLVEPTLGLSRQSHLWTAGFVALIALVAACGWRVRDAAPVRAGSAGASAAPTWRARAHWTALAFVPSGLLLSTTTHLTTDVMAIPLLWVVPLALYLASFILAFSDRRRRVVDHATKWAPLLLVLLGGCSFLAVGRLALVMAAVGLVLFLYVATTLHGELARTRPAPEHLTDFYLWVSVGGMFGGLFCGLVAPMTFDWSYEHPILLVVAALLLPVKPILRARPATDRVLRFVLPALAIVASRWIVERGIGSPASLAFAMVVVLGLVLAALLAVGHPARFAVHFAAVMLTLGGWATIDVSMEPHARARSFFGIYSIRVRDAEGVRQLVHGTTIHGAQSTVAAYATTPMTYFAPDSGVGRILAPTTADATIGLVGLGAGATLCYARPGQRWTVFEIDPLVVGIARDDRLFTYVKQCDPDVRVDVGDARLNLARYRGEFDRLIVDAFSSDAIPLHLITAEAFETYSRALKADGVLLVHVSNRFLDLEPVVAAIAAKQGWSARLRRYSPDGTWPRGVTYSTSTWIVLSRDRAALHRALDAGSSSADWRALRRPSGFQPWTDEFASILPVIKFR